MTTAFVKSSCYLLDVMFHLDSAHFIRIIKITMAQYSIQKSGICISSSTYFNLLLLIFLFYIFFLYILFFIFVLSFNITICIMFSGLPQFSSTFFVCSNILPKCQENSFHTKHSVLMFPCLNSVSSGPFFTD